MCSHTVALSSCGENRRSLAFNPDSAPLFRRPPQSLAGKTKHQLWLELCDIITKHPAEISTLPVEAILRGGIRKFTDEVGRLWVSLADFFIRRGLFEKARDVYEEARAAGSGPLGPEHCPSPSRTLAPRVL